MGPYQRDTSCPSQLIGLSIGHMEAIKQGLQMKAELGTKFPIFPEITEVANALYYRTGEHLTKVIIWATLASRQKQGEDQYPLHALKATAMKLQQAKNQGMAHRSKLVDGIADIVAQLIGRRRAFWLC